MKDDLSTSEDLLLRIVLEVHCEAIRAGKPAERRIQAADGQWMEIQVQPTLGPPIVAFRTSTGDSSDQMIKDGLIRKATKGGGLAMITNSLTLQENNTSGTGEFLVLDALNNNNLLAYFAASGNSREQALNRALTFMGQQLGAPGGGK